jgi:hypothetical protein
MCEVLWWLLPSSGIVREAGLHIALLVVLGILGQCAPVYPYVDLSG